MHKRGQFFLVAALVIAGILIGLAGVYTEVNTPQEDFTVYDLSSELNYESLQVVDQGTYTGLSQDQVNSNVVGLTNHYVEKNPTKDFVIIYGNQDSLTVLAYTVKSVGSVGLSTGGTPQTHTVTQTVLSRSSGDGTIVGDQIVVKFKGRTYTFKVSAGTSFYSVLSSQTGNQQFVAADGNVNPGASTAGTCAGEEPQGGHLRKGSSSYSAGYIGPTTWTFIELSALVSNTATTSLSTLNLDPCKWTCEYSYIKAANNECTNEDD